MKILVATGGTGGHIFPALLVASELRKAGHDIRFAGSFGAAAEKIKNSGYPLEELSARGLTAKSLKTVLSFGVSMVKSIFKSGNMIRRWRPDVVAGFGGYGAFPVVLAAACLNVPTLIHEQNVVPGRANALLARFARKIAVSFEISGRYFASSRTVFTGCPCRVQDRGPGVEAGPEALGLARGKYTIFVLGGSQGSTAINQAFVAAAPILKKRVDFQVIHVSGERDLASLQAAYRDLSVPCFLTAFLDDIDKAYLIADLVVARAGALTVNEIAAFGLPAILIPYPYAGGHQKANADVLAGTGTAAVIEQQNLSAEVLATAILAFVQNREDRLEIQKRTKGIHKPEAARAIADAVISLGRT